MIGINSKTIGDITRQIAKEQKIMTYLLEDDLRQLLIYCLKQEKLIATNICLKEHVTGGSILGDTKKSTTAIQFIAQSDEKLRTLSLLLLIKLNLVVEYVERVK